MTLSEALELEAGPELDAVVAEKVMGWVVHSRNTIHWVKAGHEESVDYWICGETCGSARWAPSTDIAALKEVILKLRERWGSFTLVAGLAWHCYPDEKFIRSEHVGSADTLELAIVRAALRAFWKE